MSENVLVLGATSGIARALCHTLCRRGCNLILAGRNLAELEKDAADLQLRYKTSVFTEIFEALDYDGHKEFFSRCVRRFDNRIDGVILCYGYLPEQAETETNFAEAQRTIDTNFTSTVSVLNHAALQLQKQESGYIAAISSVAGDRGRKSNYTYGAAKAGLSCYLQGLRNRLHECGVAVLTIKPGFVHTPMTEGLLDPRSPLVATPERVARAIDAAIRRRKDVAYTPWFWHWIMAIIVAIPERIFKRLSL